MLRGIASSDAAWFSCRRSRAAGEACPVVGRCSSLPAGIDGFPPAGRRIPRPRPLSLFHPLPVTPDVAARCSRSSHRRRKRAIGARRRPDDHGDAHAGSAGSGRGVDLAENVGIAGERPATASGGIGAIGAGSGMSPSFSVFSMSGRVRLGLSTASPSTERVEVSCRPARRHDRREGAPSDELRAGYPFVCVVQIWFSEP